MMDTRERLAIREYLARAQGWEQYPLVPGDGSVWPKDEPAKVPDPFVNPGDLISLLEWARKQKDIIDRIVIADGWIVIAYFTRNRLCVYEKRGPLSEALPLAIYRALQEVEQNGK